MTTCECNGYIDGNPEQECSGCKGWRAAHHYEPFRACGGNVYKVARRMQAQVCKDCWVARAPQPAADQTGHRAQTPPLARTPPLQPRSPASSRSSHQPGERMPLEVMARTCERMEDMMRTMHDMMKTMQEMMEEFQRSQVAGPPPPPPGIHRDNATPGPAPLSPVTSDAAVNATAPPVTGAAAATAPTPPTATAPPDTGAAAATAPTPLRTAAPTATAPPLQAQPVVRAAVIDVRPGV